MMKDYRECNTEKEQVLPDTRIEIPIGDHMDKLQRLKRV